MSFPLVERDGIASLVASQTARRCQLSSLRWTPGKQLNPGSHASALYLKISRHQLAGAYDSEMMTESDEHGLQQMMIRSMIKYKMTAMEVGKYDNTCIK